MMLTTEPRPRPIKDDLEASMKFEIYQAPDILVDNEAASCSISDTNTNWVTYS